MYISNKGLMYPIEHLVFKVKNSSDVKKFIRLDHEIWTMFLKDYPDFVAKQIWVNDSNPGEIHSIISWKTMKGWKSIPIEKLKLVDKQFTESFGSEFSLIRRIHKEYNYGLYEYCSFVK